MLLTYQLVSTPKNLEKQLKNILQCSKGSNFQHTSANLEVTARYVDFI